MERGWGGEGRGAERKGVGRCMGNEIFFIFSSFWCISGTSL